MSLMLAGMGPEDAMLHTLKAVSATGTAVAACWFHATSASDFQAVLLGIFSLSIFMMTLLPISTEAPEH